ncbi:hypothetical protein NPIL_147741, partial [Nephila pilipes]
MRCRNITVKRTYYYASNCRKRLNAGQTKIYKAQLQHKRSTRYVPGYSLTGKLNGRRQGSQRQTIRGYFKDL